nr:UDP-2,4-diacetamido-2,4,6-trideoxy-beta-L-altropyranose hydrolase [uncultured Chitinophaga sp.]
MRNKVYFRADGNFKMGLGHIFRSCAYAELLQEKFECHFFIRNPLPAVEAEVQRVKATMHVLPDDIDLDTEAEEWAARLTGKELVVLDGYHFATSYQQIIKNACGKLLCIDDIHSCHFVADAVINHAEGISTHAYSIEPYTKLYLGTHYALLRPMFLQFPRKEATREAEELFICLGGADPTNRTLDVLKGLCQKKENILCNIVVGPAYPHEETLNAYIENSSLNAKVYKGASPEIMLELMQRSRFAICSPSTVSYEYLSVGGILYLLMTAQNQEHINRFFLDAGIAFSLEEYPVRDTERIRKSQDLQKHYFDGKSGQRLTEIVEGLFEQLNRYQVRKAVEADVQLYYEWATDPEVRRNAINTAEIKFEDHQQWFGRKIADSRVLMYIVEYNKVPIGQVRFDIDSGKQETVISYSIAAAYRGKGLATDMLKAAISELNIHIQPVFKLVAVVNPDNAPSCRIFEKLRFKLSRQEIMNDVLFNIYECI